MATPTQLQRDAHQILRLTFQQVGLTSTRLEDWALDAIVSGKSLEQILLELEEQPEYKLAFPEIEARRNLEAETGVRLQPLSPAEILEYRSSAKALMRSFGVPESMYQQNSDFFDFIVGDVSLDELGKRLEFAQRRVQYAPLEVRQVFEELVPGAGDDALFATFLNVKDRTVPVLEDMVQQAEAGGAARRFGFDLTADQMLRVAGFRERFNYDLAVEGFSELDRVRSLFDETLYEADWTIGDQGVEAAFGLEGGAAEALTRRGESRAAETSGSAGGAKEQIGAIGLGTAGRI